MRIVDYDKKDKHSGGTEQHVATDEAMEKNSGIFKMPMKRVLPLLTVCVAARQKPMAVLNTQKKAMIPIQNAR